MNLTNFKKSNVLNGLIICSSITVFGTGSAYATDAEIWQKYTGDITDSGIPTLPDYSYSGYRLGEFDVPDNHTLPVFDITDYGAVANDQLSDQEAIQQAIDAAEKNNGGVVFFPAGTFLVNTDAENTKTIQISSSNIILKGSGSEPGGTVIEMKNHMLQPEGGSPWSTPNMITYSISGGSQPTSAILQDVSRGSMSIQVADASIFKGEKYLRLTMNNNLDANSDYLDGKSTNNAWSKINDEGVSLSEFHEIAEIDLNTNTLTLKDPIVDDIKVSLGWTAQPYKLMESVGFEDIHFKGHFTDIFVHHKNYIHDYGWHAINMKRVAHSWVTRSRFTNVTRTVGMGLSYASSIHTILADGNGGHHLTNVGGNSSRILQGLIWDNTVNGFYHGADLSGGTSGSVAWRVESEKGSGWDTHAAQPRTNLIDHYTSAGISSVGGHYSNLPNHLTGLTIWNQLNNGESDEAAVNYWPSPDCGNYCGAVLASPIIVGYHGNSTTFVDESVKYKESIGTKVTPESLYEAQLEHRLPETEIYTETFSNISILGWTQETYTGDNNIEWTFGSGVKSEESGRIDGSKAIYFQGNPDKERSIAVQSGIISGGISKLSIKAKDVWNEGNERVVELLINGDVVGQYKHIGTEDYIIEFNNLNIRGDFTIGLRNMSSEAGSNSVAIDDISWSSYGESWTSDAKTAYDTFKINWYKGGVPVSGISLSDEDVEIKAGESYTLMPIVTPSFATNTSVRWSTNNAAIATVDGGGKVEGVSAGDAIVTATTNDGGFSASSNINVITESNKETFSNLQLNSWGTETYVGDNGIEWSVEGKGVTDYINGSKHIYFQGNPDKPRVVAVQSGIISGGIKSFSATAKNLWNPENERKLELIVNEEVVDTFSYKGTDVYNININNINVAGDFTLAIKNVSTDAGNNTVAIDDMTWEAFDESMEIVNKAPEVSAGNSKVIILPEDTLSLSGACKDDNLPQEGIQSCMWTAPEDVTFLDASNPKTKANFKKPGSYTLTLTATDGELTSMKEVVIIVKEADRIANNSKDSGGSFRYGYILFILALLRMRKVTNL